VAEPHRLVGEVVLDACARKDDNADRHHGEHWVVASERRRLAVLVQSGLKVICGTLRWTAHLAAISMNQMSEIHR
jgi:hypothetical protein